MDGVLLQLPNLDPAARWWLIIAASLTILYAIMREALDLVDRGIISPEGMDLNVRWGIGYKLAVIGPM